MAFPRHSRVCAEMQKCVCAVLARYGGNDTASQRAVCAMGAMFTAMLMGRVEHGEV